MIIFIGGPGSGKTRRCIEFSVKTRLPILCHNPDDVKKKAKEAGLDIPEPISYSEYLLQRGRTKSSNKKVVIDELGWFLRVLGIDPVYMTIDDTTALVAREDVDILQMFEKGRDV